MRFGSEGSQEQLLHHRKQSSAAAAMMTNVVCIPFHYEYSFCLSAVHTACVQSVSLLKALFALLLLFCAAGMLLQEKIQH